MISTESRRSSVYVGDGSSVAFSFPFKIFNSDEVSVVTSDGILASNLYSVRLNDTAGGVVTLNSPLAHGVKLVIISAIPYTQGLGLTAQGSFNPEDLNKAWDKNCALVQQVKDRVDRAVVFPEFYEGTSSEFTESIFTAQRESAASAASAAQSAQAAAATAARVDAATTEGVNAIRAEGEAQRASVAAEGATQKTAVTTEGNAQVARIKTAGDATLNAQGIGCVEVSWTADKAVSAGTPIKLPHGAQFIVGRHHLRLAWNGLVLYGDTYFSEAGAANTLSSEFTLAFDLRQGDEMNAWISTLGSADASEAFATAVAAEQAVADLSRNVVYKNEQAAKE